MHKQRIGAIFEKDMKDFMKNMMLLISPIGAIILALLYHQFGARDQVLLFMSTLIVGITFSLVTTSCMMTMIAEKNEKKTLRGLIQSPASFLDIMVGKSLVTGLLTLITLILDLVIMGFGPFLNARAISGVVLLFLFFLLLGMGIGLFVKSVAAIQAYILPVMLLFGLTPVIQLLGLDKNSLILKVAHAFPVPQLIEINETQSWFPLGIIVIWVLVAALFAYFCFIKRRTDD